MRLWTKFVDEYFCPALSLLGWHAMIKNAVAHLSEAEFEAKVARIPLKEQQDKWRESAKQVWTPEQLADWRRKVVVSIQRIENGHPASMEPLKSLAAVFEVDFSTLNPEQAMTTSASDAERQEAEAFRYGCFASLTSALVALPHRVAMPKAAW